MNSTWILKLYPDHWRSRYEPEFRALLEEAPMSFMDLFDIAFGAIDAHIRPSTEGLVTEGNPQPPAAPDPDAAARRQVRLLKFFWMHAGLVALISVVLLLINALTWDGMVWSAIAICGLAIPLSIHAMVTFPWRGYFGALAVPLGVINLGLIGLNLWVNTNSPWSLWTISASLVPVIGAGLVSFKVTSPQRAFGISGVVVALLCVVASIFEPELLFHAVFELGIVAAVLYAWEQLRRSKWTLFAAHGFLFAAVNVLALVLNLVSEPDTLWFQYVLAASSLFLAVHAMVRFGLLESYDANWEEAKVARLISRIRESAVTDEVQRRIFRTARIQRSFWMHLFFATVGALDLAIINMLSGTDRPWLVWPIGVWLVMLGVHAGYAFGPNRWLSANLMFWIGTSLGLVAIDTWEPATRWWFWPVAAYGMVIAAHLGWVIVRPRWYGAVLGSALSMIPFLVMTDRVTGGSAWWYWPTIGIVAVIALVTPFAFNVLQRISQWESRKVASISRK
ncbi:MAG: 2TM domain-containing protein [Thermomicrobiales bacterium]